MGKEFPGATAFAKTLESKSKLAPQSKEAGIKWEWFSPKSFLTMWGQMMPTKPITPR